MFRENPIAVTPERAGIRLDRLAEVVRAVENARDSEFYMGQWRNECGTVGCAIGHYCRRNPDAELKLVVDSSYMCVVVPAVGRLRVYAAVADHFGISRANAERLFSFRHDYQTRTDVLTALRAFIADNSSLPDATAMELTARASSDRFDVSPVTDDYMASGMARLERDLEGVLT